jgi:hypothetical protein
VGFSPIFFGWLDVGRDMFSTNLAVILRQIMSVAQDISHATYYLPWSVHSHPGMVMLCTKDKSTKAIAQVASSIVIALLYETVPSFTYTVPTRSK